MEKITVEIMYKAFFIYISALVALLVIHIGGRNHKYNQISVKITDCSQPTQYEANYNACLLELMYSEDMISTPKPCPAGFMTVGFGHNTETGCKTSKNLNYRQSFDLLTKDFNNAIKQAETIGFKDKDNKQLAVAHIIFALGIKHALNITKDNSLSSVFRYVYYNKSGIMTRSENLYKNRAFEYELFHLDNNKLINLNDYL